MVEGFDRNYTDQSPYYEVWYGKIDIAPGQALWFRYTLLDGESQEASCWAILFDEGDVIGEREVWELEDLAPGNVTIIPRTRDIERFRNNKQVFHIGDCHLDESNALGSVGPLNWDLTWTDSGRRFRYVPQLLKTLGLAGSTYNSCLFDLEVSGSIHHDDSVYDVDGATGMVGHIEGRKIIGDSWGWAHCNNFDNHPNAAFEGLSAKLQLAGTVTPPLSAFVLFLEDRKYTFRSPISIIRSQSGFNREEWVFKTSSGGVKLQGQAEAPQDVALVEYTDTDDSNLWCYNSKLADLTLEIRDEKNGIERKLVSSGRSAYEWVTRTPPDEPILID